MQFEAKEKPKEIDTASIKTRSPQCPSISLKEAVKKTESVYKENNKHQVASDAVAQALGYKNANNGAALRTMASLAYFGLLNKNGNGKLNVSTDYEKYAYAPDVKIKQDFLLKWIRNPKIFCEVFDKYGYNLPSDNALKYDLIERGFKPDAADNAVAVIRESVHFLLENADLSSLNSNPVETSEDSDMEEQEEAGSVKEEKKYGLHVEGNFRIIPVFLPNNREAALHLPRPFHTKDREIIKRQIDAILADDE